MTALAVHAEYRGSGLGSSLVGKAEEIAHAAGASHVSLSVEEANTGAVRFYLRHGFVEWTRRPYVPFPGSKDEGDWILLKKQIAISSPLRVRGGRRSDAAERQLTGA